MCVPVEGGLLCSLNGSTSSVGRMLYDYCCLPIVPSCASLNKAERSKDNWNELFYAIPTRYLGRYSRPALPCQCDPLLLSNSSSRVKA